jgi:hypothetical protein
VKNVRLLNFRKRLTMKRHYKKEVKGFNMKYRNVGGCVRSEVFMNGYEECCFLGYDTEQSDRNVLSFQRNILLPS